MKWNIFAGLVVGMALSPGVALPSGDHEGGHDDETTVREPSEIRLIMPIMDSGLGRELFASKGCVACHSVNGVGGEDASSLDAHDMDPYMNPFDLAARMWRMAPFMIEAQEEAFGEQIQFTGDELSAIIAFLHDEAEQHRFTEDSLSPAVMEMMDHEHGDQAGEDAHAEELGHDDDHD
jgi:cytochrome c